jgi:hypothetical protein
VTFRKKMDFYGEVVTPLPTSNLKDHALSAVANAYSVYSQLPSIPTGRLLHPQPGDAPCYGDRDPLNMVLIPIYSQLPSISGGRLLHPQLEAVMTGIHITRLYLEV